MQRTTYAIVGANLAGGRAALALRAEGFEGDVVLIGAESHPPYERPPLSKDVLKGTRSPESTYLRPVDAYTEAGIDLRLGVRVTRLSPRWKALELADGSTIAADRILLCTGGRVRRLDVPGTDLDGVYYLRAIDDAVAIRDQLGADVAVTVVGAGFIGSEVAACAREAGCAVTMLEVAEVPLSRVLGSALGALYARVHREHGVDVRTRTGVASITGDARRVQRVVTSDGAGIDTQIVVIGVGIDPASELAEDAGIDVADGIVVDDRCRTSMPNVYAAGDVAWHPNPLLGSHMRLEHWQNAQNHAVAAARSMVDRGKPYAEVPWFWSDQYDLNLQMAGRPSGADDVVVRGTVDDLSFCAFYLCGGRLTGAVAVNRPRDLRGAMTLIEKGVLVDPDALADETVEARGLALS